MTKSSTIRLGLIRLSLGGVGCVGMLFAFAALYAVSALFWGWVIMLILGACHVNPIWPHTHGNGYWSAVFPWGLLAPFVLG